MLKFLAAAVVLPLLGVEASRQAPLSGGMSAKANLNANLHAFLKQKGQHHSFLQATQEDSGGQTPGTVIKVNIKAKDNSFEPPPSLKDINSRINANQSALGNGTYIGNVPYVNPCEDGTNGGCAQMCLFHLGDYACGCIPGYKLAGDDVSCADINECTELEELPNGGCDDKCHNMVGTYHCTCPKGYLLVNGTACVDIDECLVENGGCQQVCLNTKGSHVCDCFEGYQAASNTTCEDVDECLVENGGCTDMCTNLIGSFECSCNEGYYFDPTDPKKLRCLEINECDHANTSAHFHGCSQVCHNTPGSFECGCFPGYKMLDDGKSCEDINECLGNHGCHSTAHGPLASGAQCENLPGSYVCKCQHPLVLVGNHTCDIDECAVHPAGAPAGAPAPAAASVSVPTTTVPASIEFQQPNGGCSHGCKNLPGGFICTCPPGYVLDENPEIEDPGKTCKDIDECTDRPDLVKCSGEGVVCQNTPGSFTCGCAEGYQLQKDGNSCSFVADQSLSGAGSIVSQPPPPILDPNAVGAPAGAPGFAPPSGNSSF